MKMLYPTIKTKIKCLKGFTKETEHDNISFKVGKSYIVTNYGRSYYKETESFEDVWYVMSLNDNSTKFSISRKGMEYLYNKKYLEDE